METKDNRPPISEQAAAEIIDELTAAIHERIKLSFAVAEATKREVKAKGMLRRALGVPEWSDDDEA